jgi:hypothetical protein
MGTSSQELFPYDSLDKYSEALIQCPICLYYFKVNSQTYEMKYRSLSRSQIHFLTIHTFNELNHSIIIEYLNFSYSKIIDSHVYILSVLLGLLCLLFSVPPFFGLRMNLVKIPLQMTRYYRF